MSYFADCLHAVREKRPLVHHLTNYVTVQSCANMTLAVGASPIMADDLEEAGDIAAMASALVLNIGTLNSRTVEAMLEAGRRANAAGVPVVLDPVGAGASALRTQTALKLMEEVKFTVIRGNISEIKTLAAGSGSTRGVDADVADAVTEETLDASVAFAKAMAAKTGAVIAITGAIDLVADAERCYVIRNGRPEMGKITGTGCQLSGLTTAYVVANPGNELEAVAAAVVSMGLAGEIGWANMAPTDGNSTYRNRIIDAIFHMDAETLDKGAKYEVR